MQHRKYWVSAAVVARDATAAVLVEMVADEPQEPSDDGLITPQCAETARGYLSSKFASTMRRRVTSSEGLGDWSEVPMRFGIALPIEAVGLSGRTLVEWMRRVDDSPFSTVAVTDEIVSYTYDSLTTLAAAAALTRDARLMSVVIGGPPRDTALLAKQSLTVDALSGGRLSLGLSVGELVEDFAVTGTEMRGRGKVFDRQLELLRRIWSGEPMGESGRAIGPPPVRPGGPELLLGGWAAPAMRRIGRYADGYAGAVLTEEMVSDEPYQVALESWRDHGREGRPRFVMNVYYALGPEADAMVEAHLRAAYAGAPEYDLRALANAIPRTDKDVQAMIGRLEGLGVDELILHPISAELDQFDRIADLVPS
jgi:alkanesulfonate monooxygenase SsuD/methylene tetrahydromethanopterin reductase-like flavin-dependent oxidoreductase (luciferase family)